MLRILLSVVLSIICSLSFGFAPVHYLSARANVPMDCRLNMLPLYAPVRVRFAPSPTGSLHVGGARTAMFNWLLAKKTKGKFIVRVEDTDEKRSTDMSEKSILDDMEWLNMKWDEGPGVGGPHGPYRQSDRKHIYTKIANYLIEKGFAYHCFCSVEELSQKRDALRLANPKNHDERYDGTWRNADPVEVQRRLDNKEPYAVRFRVPPGKIVSVLDKVKGRVTWDADRCLGDFILMRSNGMPVYNFCVAVDDIDMQITHVIRGDEHLVNTLRQILIMEALEYKPPLYAHCPLIIGADKSKLSKRHGATSVSQFRERGYLPEAMISYLSRMGWRDTGRFEAGAGIKHQVRAFSLDKMIHNPTMFSEKELNKYQRLHMSALSFADLQQIVVDQLCRATNISVSGSNHTITAPSVFSKDALVEANLLSPSVINFLSGVTRAANQSMLLTVDASITVGRCLHYNLLQSLEHDPVAREMFASPSFALVGRALIRDHASGALPCASLTDFSDRWNDYTKQLGEELGLKDSEDILKTMRLCLTGVSGGLELSEFMRFMSTLEPEETQQIVNPAFEAVFMKQRMEILKGVLNRQ